VALTYVEASSSGALNVPGVNEASLYKPGELFLHLELLTKAGMTRAGRVMSPSRPEEKGNMPSPSLAKKSDERSGAKITHEGPRMTELSLPPRSSYDVNVQIAGSPPEYTDVVPLVPAHFDTNKSHAVRSLLAPTTNLDRLSDTGTVPENTMVGTPHDNPLTATCQHILPSLTGDEATKEPEQTKHAELHLTECHQAEVDLIEIAPDKRANSRHVQRQDIGMQCPRRLISRAKSLPESRTASREEQHFISIAHDPPAEDSEAVMDDCYCNVEGSAETICSRDTTPSTKAPNWLVTKSAIRIR
jgi:hypothetical protein